MYKMQYFINENTFNFRPEIVSKNDSAILSNPYKIRFIDSTYLIIEPINLMYFDFVTGRILTEQEYQKKKTDIENSRKNKPLLNIEIKGKPQPTIYWVFKKG